MTDEQIKKVKILARCSFQPASYDKRFVRSMATIAASEPEKALTERQDAFLTKLFHRYRRQHKRQLAHDGVVLEQKRLL